MWKGITHVLLQSPEHGLSPEIITSAASCAGKIMQAAVIIVLIMSAHIPPGMLAPATLITRGLRVIADAGFNFSLEFP